MITLRRGAERGYVDFGWLRSFHSFSFGDYYDPLAEVDAAFLNDVVHFVVTATAPAPVTTAPAPAAHAGRRPAR